MKLNRDNYEEYFILYLDNELDADSRREVEAFAAQHPDLKAELDMLMQSKLTPDTEVHFADKGSLMRFDSAAISLANYEEWLTSYIDNELADGERRDVEVFVAGNPAIQRELNLLQKAKLQPEIIPFPNKESLYRKEEKAKVIAIRWWRMAAAAVLLFGIITTAVIVINNRHDDEQGPITNVPAKDQTGKDETHQEDALVNEQNQSPVNTQPPIAQVTSKQQTQTEDQAKHLASNKPVNKIKVEEEVPGKVNDKSPVVVKVDDPEYNNIIIPGKENDQNMPGKNDALANVNSPAINPDLTNEVEKAGFATVTNNTSNTYHKVEEPEKSQDNPDVKFAKNDGGGVRGFLRKVTRNLEKRTNIKATDEDDRLLIAGLAIKL